MTENVIYVYDGDYQPEWQYYSMPHSCVGGGSTPQAAGQSYREALAFQLEVDIGELPQIREHVETEAHDGIYIRYALGDPIRAQGAKGVAELLRTPFYDSQLQESLHSSTTAGGYPVLVIVQPEDTISWVTDQMTDRDSLWLLTPIEAVPIAPTGDVGPGIPLLGLLPVVGPYAEDADAPHHVELNRQQLETMTVHDLMQRYARPSNMGLPIAEMAPPPRVAPRIQIPAMV